MKAQLVGQTKIANVSAVCSRQCIKRWNFIQRFANKCGGQANNFLCYLGKCSQYALSID